MGTPLVLLTILLILVIVYLRKRAKSPSIAPRPEMWPSLRALRECGIEIPQGYCFHLCHTWVVSEGEENARVGLDSFVANLFGEIDQIEVIGLDRWVRQGQKLMTVTGAGISVDLLSPVEGVVKAQNQAALKDPTLVITSPYNHGWIAMIKSPAITTDLKNLVQGAMVVPWMRNTLARLKDMVAQLSPALAQDGGPPLRGLLSTVPPELQSKLVKEFFLTSPVPRAQSVMTL